MQIDVLSRIRSGKLWDFPGGIHPQENKKQSNQKPIRTLHLPKFFYVPVLQHSGTAGELLVKAGDHVLKGQPLTKGDHYRQLPVHSPTSGIVKAIEPYVSSHPSGLPELTIVIETDGKDEWCERNPIDDFFSLTSDQILQKIYQAGIAGLGGAVFPTSSKLSYADKRCKLLIINGAECEPYITCDDRLMQDYTLDMIEGIRILRYLLRPEEVVIAIEDNKPKAIKAVQKALDGSNDIQLRVIPTKYPSGASDQLVQILTGLEIPQGSRTIEMGIVMQNVGTAYAVKRAVIDDEPLIERVVTLTGDKIRNKGNVWARLGTPIIHLLEQVDYQADERFPVFLGGPMMGFILPSLQSPVTKTANCIIAPDHFEYAPPEPERNCIRCSSCSDACPVGLLPQQLYWFARSDDHDKAKQYHIDACIECGVCAYVCPSYIPLIQYFRQEKAKIAEADDKARKAEEAKQRFEAREARMQKEKEARNARIQKAAEKRREEVANSEGIDPVKAALERLKAKKAETAEQKITETGEPDNTDLIAQRKARRLAKQAQQAEQSRGEPMCSPENEAEEQGRTHQSAPTENLNSSETDPRKAAVVAALARARAKKQAQQAEQGRGEPTCSPENEAAEQGRTHQSTPTENLNSSETDPRKAAVAAALARAKAKKAEKSRGEPMCSPENEAAEQGQTHQSAPTENLNSSETDPRKAAVAAALARAKAKKQAQQAEQSRGEPTCSPENEAEEYGRTHRSAPTENLNSSEIDPRKAAVAAAIARAKAKKAASRGEPTCSPENEAAEQGRTHQSTPTENVNSVETDPRKAAVAAAIARAKARKQNQEK